MARSLLFLGLTALLILLPAAADEPKKADPKKGNIIVLPAASTKQKADPKTAVKDKIVSAGNFVGKLVKFGEANAYLTIQVTYQVAVPDFANMTVNVEDRQQDYQFEPAENMKVRVLRLEAVFDAKGKVKKFTEKELKDLKGPGNLPGYAGDFDQLKLEQYVRVFLTRKKDDPNPVIAMIVILTEPAE